MQTNYKTSLNALSALIAGGIFVSLFGCTGISSVKNDIHSVDQIDPGMKLTRDDYIHMDATKKEPGQPYMVTIEKGAPPIPKLEDILAAPRPPKIGETQLVSIAVTDDVPLKDVLLELAKLADVDIELDAGITGGISFIAKDKPFNEVVDRIADLANLRYTMKNGVLRVERDTAFIKSYSIDFLNMDRDSDSSVNLSTNVLSSGGGSSGGSSSGGSSGGGGGGGLNTGSTSSVKSKTTGDFWKSLESGVQQILAFTPAQRVSDTTMQAETDANLMGALTGGPNAKGAPGSPAAAASTAASSAAAAVASQSAAAGAAGGAGGTVKNYTINRQAGVLTVDATEKQQEMIQHLLDMLKKNASAQVLIEAKILEVSLDQQYQSGIDWARIGNKLNAGINFNTIGNALGNPAVGPLSTVVGGIAPTTNMATLTLSTGSIDALLSLVEQFGTTRTLSSPRLHAINNQQSTMTFAENVVYFQVTVSAPVTTSTTGGVSTTPTEPTVSSSIQTVPIGIMMTMMPSIDVDNNEVTLAVRPTLSTVVDEVPDPAVTIEAAANKLTGVQSLIPEIQVRELDSTLKLKSGQTMVIGGLMQQSGTNGDIGVPYLSSIPIVGNVFKNINRQSTNKELVLLIKATIVDTGGSLNKLDSDVFHKFSNDPRPVSF